MTDTITAKIEESWDGIKKIRGKRNKIKACLNFIKDLISEIPPEAASKIREMRHEFEEAKEELDALASETMRIEVHQEKLLEEIGEAQHAIGELESKTNALKKRCFDLVDDLTIKS